MYRLLVTIMMMIKTKDVYHSTWHSSRQHQHHLLCRWFGETKRAWVDQKCVSWKAGNKKIKMDDRERGEIDDSSE